REHGVGEHVLVRTVAARQRQGLRAQLLPFGLEQVGRTAGDRRLLGVFRGCLKHLGVALAEGGAVVAEHQVGKLAGEDLVAAHEHVEDRLGAHDLAGRRHQRRVACVLPGTSAKTSLTRSLAPCCFSWLSMFEIMPPGIWLSKISVSTPMSLDSKAAYLGRTLAKWSLIFWSRSLSSLVV